MIDDHHAVEYDGSSKELIEEQHLKNREILLEKGEVELWSYPLWIVSISVCSSSFSVS